MLTTGISVSDGCSYIQFASDERNQQSASYERYLKFRFIPVFTSTGTTLTLLVAGCCIERALSS